MAVMRQFAGKKLSLFSVSILSKDTASKEEEIYKSISISISNPFSFILLNFSVVDPLNRKQVDSSFWVMITLMSYSHRNNLFTSPFGTLIMTMVASQRTFSA